MTSRVVPGGVARSAPEAGEQEPDRPAEAARGGAGPNFGWTWLERPRARRAVWAMLAAEIITVAVFSVVYRPFDLNIYLWGGRSVTHGLRLYQVMADHNWFTYPPFSASLFTPLDAVPQVLVQLAWGLGTIAAIAWAALICLRLAGYRPSRTEVAAVTVAGVTLEPVYHTLFLGQVNVFLMALVLADIGRAARGRPAGIGTGLAAAIKLTPAIFIVLFLLTRRIRDAVTAVATLGACVLIGFLVDPAASRLYWSRLFYDTRRVNVPYISNQSVYSAFVRIMGGTSHVGGWFQVIPLVLGAVGLVVAATLARRGDWLAAAAVTGGTGLLVSPISWTHHWVWILPALIVLLRGGRGARIGAAAAYVLFVLAPMWWTPHPGAGGTGQFGVHGLLTPVANCFMIAGLVFLGYMTVRTVRPGPASRSRDRAGVLATGVHRRFAGRPCSPDDGGCENAGMPWIELEGAVNVRDLGGLPAGNGDRTVAGRLLRADNLQELTPSDIARLVHDIGVTTIVDLRSTAELTSEGPAPLDAVAGVRHAHHPVLPELGAATDAVADVLLTRADQDRSRYPSDPVAGHYLGYLEDRPDQVVAALRSIATSAGAALVHCAAGKDRTGVVVAVALTAVGVPAEVVVADYAATGQRTEQIVDRLRRSPTYADDINSKDARSHRPRPETMAAFLDQVDARHGGVTAWLAGHGFGAEDVSLLAARLRQP